MRRMALLISVTALIATTLPVLAQGQPANLVPSGNTNLPSGQYMITNMNSGQSYYAFVNQSGQLLVQDPRALQFSVQQQGAQIGTAVSGQSQSQSGSGFGGFLKQGLQNMLQNQLSPTQAPQSNAPYGQ